MLQLLYDEYLDHPIAIGTSLVLMLAAIICACFNVQLTIVLTVLLMIVPVVILQRKYHKSYGESLGANFFFCILVSIVLVLSVLFEIVNKNDLKYNGGWVYSAKVVEIKTGPKTRYIEVEYINMQGNPTKESVDNTYFEKKGSPYVLLARTYNLIDRPTVIEKHISETDYLKFRKGKFVINDDYHNPKSEAEHQYAQKMIDRYIQNNENFIIVNKIMIGIILIVGCLLFSLMTGKQNIYLLSAPTIFIAAVQCYSHSYFYNIELLIPWLISSFAGIKLSEWKREY